MNEGIARKMCLDKKYYPSIIKAFCAVGRLKVLFPERQLRAYECPICNGWHLSSKPQREEPAPPLIPCEKEIEELFV